MYNNVKKYLHNSLSLSLLIAFALSLICILSACSDDDDTAQNGYGYFQVELIKKGINVSGRAVEYAMVEGKELNHLNEARKIKLSLRYKGKNIEQTLNLTSASTEAAEYGITSESLKMQSGEYELLGYAIIGDYKDGDMAEILQVCTPEEKTTITINPDELTRQQLTAEAKKYGKFSAHIVRLEPEVSMAKGAPVYSEAFAYNDIDSVQVVMERRIGGIAFREDHKMKAYKGASDIPVFDTDSIDLQTGEYMLTHFELFNKRGQFMYAQDVEIPFSISHYSLTSEEVGVQLSDKDPIINDGIALRQIWDAMDGENWSWHELDGNGGANWIFKMSDGSPRPISAWVRQVGVTVVNNRVVSLNLGSFNPKGVVPDAIGRLDALEKLYLGMHTDEVYYQLEGVGDVVYALNPYNLGQINNRPDRMTIARERSIIRRMNQNDFSLRTSRLLYKGHTEAVNKLSAMKFASKVSTYGQNTSDPANRITGISPAIGNLRNLQELYIANTLITHLPIEMQKLTSITDLEMYNNPFEDVDGEIFKDMTYLTSVNFDSFYKMQEDKIHAMLNKMFTYCQKIQLLYMNRMKLTHLPERLNYLTDLRLLDASFNKITSVSSLRPMAPIQLMMNYNLIEELPADFINTDDLELFSMTDNKLKHFPAVLSNRDGLYTISEVDLTGNKMHGFQPGFKGIRVEQLKMGVNNLGYDYGSGKREFPREFSQYNSEINYLVISGNNIDTIRNVAIEKIKFLQAFDVSVNNLTAMPGYMNTEHFPYLTGLEISHNRFKGFPENVLNISSLSQLLCSNQGYFRDAAETQWIRTMTAWPEYLHQHGSLTNVDLSGNDFRTVTNFPTNLTTLNVTNNPNIKMVIPQWIFYKMQQGLFVLYCDKSQDITVE